MINFKEVEILDKEWVRPLLRLSAFKGCEYSFGTIYNWKKIFHTKIARMDNYFLSSSQVGGKISYLYPAGSGDIAPVIEALMADAKERKQPFSMFSVPEEGKAKLEMLFPDKFVFQETRDSFDYIYDAEKLATLTGKKLASKRNHINYFLQHNDWSYEEITAENIDECYLMNKEWCERNQCSLDKSLSDEICAVKSAFRHFFELDFMGGLLRSNGKVVAFTIGEHHTEDTLLVHIEKAFSDVRGAYPMINKQFVMHHADSYQYVNREDDTGDEGLRKAKLSYHPVILLKKYRVSLREDV